MESKFFPARRRPSNSLGDYARAFEAVCVLAAARVAIAWMPFRWTISGVHDWRRSAAEPERAIGAVCQAIERMSRRAPFRAKCFERALAAHWMLGWRGVSTRLHYGIGHGEAGELLAHVWLSFEDRVLLGDDAKDDVAEVASWPSGAPPQQALKRAR